MSPLRLLLLLLVALPMVSIARPSDGSELPALDKERVPSAGRNETIATIPAFGRFAIIVTSEEGTAVQLVDRMAGPGSVHGAAGEADGRIDEFLDKGDHKIVTRGHPAAIGEARIAIKRFEEKSEEPLPLLIEHRPVEATLYDLEQRSFWIHLPEERRVGFEAAGRSLADLRLWRDGRWLVDAEPMKREVQARPGESIGICQLTAHLSAGLYLLTAYGGPARDWSNDTDASGEHALHLRYGIPSLPAVGRSRRTLSPFGSDRFRLPPESRFVRIELPEPTEAELRVVPFDSSRPFRSDGRRAEIHKTSIMPVAELTKDPSETGLMATIVGEAGQTYILQHFPEYEDGQWFRPIFFEGDPATYWVSTIHSGHAADLSDATAVLMRQGGHSWTPSRGIERARYRAVEVGLDTPWVRRFDLQGETSVHLNVTQAGSYRFDAELAARFRIEPLLVTRPARYAPPALKRSGDEWSLGKGAHLLTIVPETRGVSKVSLGAVTPISPLGGIWSQFLGIDGQRLENREAKRALSAAQWPSVKFEPGASYALRVASRPGVRTGIVVRRLPIDPRDPLPVLQEPGETMQIPIRVSEAGVLRAIAEDGSLLFFSLDRVSSTTEARLEPGIYEFRLQNDEELKARYSLELQPDRLSAEVPLPRLSDALLDERPVFPVLLQGQERHFNLSRTGQAYYSMEVDSPGLYRLESTGLLDTEGNVRTRTNPSLKRRAGGGSGRNFQAQLYLREGEYQATVTALGRSAGRLGLRFSPTALTDGGVLRDGVPARARLPAGEGLLYRLEVEEKGEYRVESLGLGGPFAVRLEDADGWPLLRPGVMGDLSVELEPGLYRLIVVPGTMEGKCVTRVSRVISAQSFSGKGPHRLSLDESITHQWREPPEGEARDPDVWLFELPAAGGVKIQLAARMEGELFSSDEKVADIVPTRGWSGLLAAGIYRLELSSVRPDDRLTYQLMVRPSPLMAGLTREVRAPSRIPVSVGEPGMVSISAFGRADVRALLFDASGRLVAKNDDRPGDWSFLISTHLETGEYQLRVEPVGSSRAVTKVSMELVAQVEGPPLGTPVSRTLRPGEEMLVHPLTIESGGLLILSAASFETIGLAIDASSGDGEPWVTLASRIGRRVALELPLPGSAAAPRVVLDPGRGATGRRSPHVSEDQDPEGGANSLSGDRHESDAGWRYRLRLWSVDRRGKEVELRAVTVMPRAVTEADLAKGARMHLVDGFELAVARVEGERPGTLKLRSPEAFETIRFSDQVHAPARSSFNGTLLRGGSEAAWVVRELPDGASRKEAELILKRVELRVEEQLVLRVPAKEIASVDLDPEPPKRWFGRRRKIVHGPVVVLAKAREGRPAIEIVDGDRDPERFGDLSVLGLGPRTAVGVSLSGERRVARFWNAERDERGRNLDVRASLTRNAPAEPEAVEAGMHAGAVAGGQSRSFDLPKGAKALHLVLDEWTVGVLSDGEAVRSVHGGTGRAVSEVLQTSASTLTIMPVRSDRGGGYSFELLPAIAPDEHLVAAGRPFERVERKKGVLRLAIAGSEGPLAPTRTVRARGAIEKVLFLGSDGMLSHGDSPVPSDGGTLLLHHGVGPLFVWLDGHDEDRLGLIALDEESAPARSVSLPSIVNLSGRIERLRIESSEERPVILHLRGAEPVVVSISGPGLERRVDIHQDGIAEDLVLPRGEGTVLIRAVGARVLGSTLSISSTELLEAGEGLGPRVMLGPGQARAFSFDVERAGPVGVGAWSEADHVECWVLDGEGRLASGAEGGSIVAMPRLEAGRYFLFIRARSNVSPTWARPALAGTDPPDTGPPEEVLGRYLKRADREEI